MLATMDCRARFRMSLRAGVLMLVALLCAVCGAEAAEVRVFNPREEGVNPSQLRQDTLQLAFDEGVYQSALKLLPASLSEERGELLKEHMAASANAFVLGYKELAATPSAEGLSMVVDVDVNRRALREQLERMGLFHTLSAPLNVTMITEGTLTQEDLATVAKLRILTGVSPAYATLPELRIGREPDGPVRGVLRTAAGHWSALDADVRTVWFSLWERYFASDVLSRAGVRAEVLSVTGWFTPDGANEFDNVLRSWESELRDVRLVDMDLAPEGVSARWELDISDQAALLSRLEQYLPSRGLSYTLSGSE